MPKSFDQFSGEGQKYAPKPAAKPKKAAEPFVNPRVETQSEESKMRDTLILERAGIGHPAQSTDHMN